MPTDYDGYDDDDDVLQSHMQQPFAGARALRNPQIHKLFFLNGDVICKLPVFLFILFALVIINFGCWLCYGISSH